MVQADSGGGESGTRVSGRIGVWGLNFRADQANAASPCAAGFILIAPIFRAKMNPEMLRKRHAWLAVMVIITIAVVLIAPSVDLQPTALRAWQAACAFFIAMAATLHVLAARVQLQQLFRTAISKSPSIIDTITRPLSSILLC